MSRSVRLSDKLIQQASQVGEAFTRSAAQQVEHWARLGQELEASGLSVAELAALLQGRIQVVDSAEMMRDKRARQAADLKRAKSRGGQTTHLFGGEVARRARVKGPF